MKQILSQLALEIAKSVKYPDWKERANQIKNNILYGHLDPRLNMGFMGNMNTGAYRKSLITFPINFSESNIENFFPSTTSAMAVNTTTDLLDLIFRRGSGASARTCVFDIRNSVVGAIPSNTLWGLRIQAKLTSKTGNVEIWMGLSSGDETVSQGTAQDFIGFNWNNVSLGTYYTTEADGVSLPVASGDASQTSTWAATEIVYIQILRTSATTATVEIFNNSDYSTGSRGLISMTIPSTIQDTPYIKWCARDNATDTVEAVVEVDNVNFVNGATTGFPT